MFSDNKMFSKILDIELGIKVHTAITMKNPYCDSVGNNQ